MTGREFVDAIGSARPFVNGPCVRRVDMNADDIAELQASGFRMTDRDGCLWVDYPTGAIAVVSNRAVERGQVVPTYESVEAWTRRKLAADSHIRSLCSARSACIGSAQPVLQEPVGEDV